MMSKSGTKGFTLVEVMVTAAVLSLGATLLYQAFFTSLNIFEYCVDYLRVSSLVDEKIWEAQDELRRRGPSAGIDSSGEFVNKARNFPWNLNYGAIDEKNGLYRIDFNLSWKSVGRDNALLRTAYATYKK
ncbi:MAG: prepilin-type N-terminal cleavage/methylation domain-containing protein [Candidatus Omnitrophota bacterium]